MGGMASCCDAVARDCCEGGDGLSAVPTAEPEFDVDTTPDEVTSGFVPGTCVVGTGGCTVFGISRPG